MPSARSVFCLPRHWFPPTQIMSASAKSKASVYAKSFGAYCVELEVAEVWSAGVTLSASDTAVLGSVSDGDDAVEIEASSPDVVVVAVPLSGTIAAADDVAETNGCAFWINVPFGCNAY